MTITLPPDYYLDNFRHLVKFVAERYRQLLSAEELAYYQRFNALPPRSQMLYIRLLTRRRDIFLQGKLHYVEIGDIAAAAEPLQALGLLAIQPELSLEQVLPLFSKHDIVCRLDQPELKPLTRAQLEQRLLECTRAQDAVVKKLCGGEVIYRVLDSALFTTYKLCFFGNLRQDLTDYILRDLGLQQYEDYPLEDLQLPFTDRAQIERHLDYYRHSEDLDATLASDSDTIVALWRALPAADAQDSMLCRRIERLGNILARQLERLGKPEPALEIYAGIRQPPARERTVRILVKEGDIEAGLCLCREIARHPVNEEERNFALEFGYRQAKKVGVVWPEPRRYRPPAETLALRDDKESVEAAVAARLNTEGSCFYVENALLNGVLGLVIWDIVFAPIKGAFFHPFQQAPADFYHTDFTVRRQAAIERRLQQVSNPAELEAMAWQRYHAKKGLANPLVNWSVLSESLLRYALGRIPPEHWQLMFRRLLADLRYHRSGMPDLVTFPNSGGYQWVEVKGPGDRLQKNQRRWLAFFADSGIPHRVIHVDWLATP